MTESAQIANVQPYSGPETYFAGTISTLFKITFTSPPPFATGQKLVLNSTTATWWKAQAAATIKRTTSSATTFTSPGLSERSTGRAIQFTTTGTMPGGMTQKTTYYVGARTATEFTLHTSQADAEAGTKALPRLR